MLTRMQQNVLLSAARSAIAAEVKNEPAPHFVSADAALLEPHGAFVTLYRAGELRGCIGYIESPMPLLETVEEVAIRSATEDPRFLPITAEELDDIDIEISVLSSPATVKNIDDIDVGRHGLIIEAGRMRGLLLPQVATEYGWDRETFLRETCRKAGLPPGSWKSPGTKIYSFTAEIIESGTE
jgi:AmmeMemoRadiSam system protein A